MALALLLNFQALRVFAEGAEDFEQKDFLVLDFNADYIKAVKMAQSAAKKLSLRYDSQGLLKNKEIGLTEAKKVCKENGWDFPCYVSRGRGKEDSYLSVEYSESYKKMGKKRYVIMAGFAAKGDPGIRKLLERVKKIYPGAQILEEKVYIGCMH